MAEDTQKQNFSAAYELLKHGTNIGEADTFEELGPSAVYKTSVVLWLMLFLLGIFSVAYHSKQNGHNFVLRPKKDRFNRIRKSAEVVNSTETSKCYRVQWRPSPKERKTTPDLPKDCVICAKLHELGSTN